MKHLLLGDIHGLWGLVERKANDYDVGEIITIGDGGIGFPGLYGPPFNSVIPIRMVRGNHDNPEFIKNLTDDWPNNNFSYIPDGTIEDGILYIGGAYSIDRRSRTPGVDWWFDEELSIREKEYIINNITNHNGPIHTVISHDCPISMYPSVGISDKVGTNTPVFLNYLLNYVLIDDKRPHTWYFGHHHMSLTKHMEGINFRCLNAVDSNDEVVLES